MRRILPFQNTQIQEFRNLVLFMAFLLYSAQIGLALHFDNLFNTLGSDFLGFWTTGYIANTKGYAYIYNPELISSLQKPYHETVETDKIYVPIHTAFVPAFGLPFQLLALLSLPSAFFVWSILNLGVFIFYLRFLLHELSGREVPPYLMAFFLLSYPLFTNFFWGQVNIWIMVCIGEFMRLTKRGSLFQGGLWLAGILIKPQALIFLIPILVIKRSMREIAGFTTGAAILLIASIALSGSEGIKELMQIWLGFASGIPTNAPEHMVNWRMVMTQLEIINQPTAGRIAAMVGVIITVILSLQLLRKPWAYSAPEFPTVLLGIMASTAIITWHSHTHMMLMFLPPFAYLIITKRISANILNFWSIAPPILMLLSLLLTLQAGLGILPNHDYNGLILGWWGLALNLSIVWWTSNTFNTNFENKS
jgi:hypothetical protein